MATGTRRGGRQAGDEQVGGNHPFVDLDAVVDHRTVDGQRVAVTLLDRCCETLRTGGTIADAAARLGVHKETYLAWIREGTKLSVDMLAGRVTAAKLTKAEQRAVRFTIETERASAERKMFLLGLAQRGAQGGYERTTVTETIDAQGQITSTSTRTQHAEPDYGMVRWLLERQYRSEWGPHVVVTGPEGGPVQIEDKSALDKLTAVLDAKAQQIASAQQAIAEATAAITANAAPPPAVNANGHG